MPNDQNFVSRSRSLGAAGTLWLAAMILLTHPSDAAAAQPSTDASTPTTTQQQQPPPLHICPICGQANNQNASYSVKAAHTLARGGANTFLGWTEVIRQPADEVRAGGNLFTGIAKGIGRGVSRTFAGAGELLTFWTPKIQNSYVHFANDCPVCMGRRTTN